MERIVSENKHRQNDVSSGLKHAGQYNISSYAQILKGKRPNIKAIKCSSDDLDLKNNIGDEVTKLHQNRIALKKVKLTRVPFDLSTDEVIKEVTNCASIHLQACSSSSAPVLAERYCNGESTSETIILSVDDGLCDHLIRRRAIRIGASRIAFHEVMEEIECWNCLMPGHTHMKCAGKTTCKYCSGNHNHRVCTDKTKLRCKYRARSVGCS